MMDMANKVVSWFERKFGDRREPEVRETLYAVVHSDTYPFYRCAPVARIDAESGEVLLGDRALTWLRPITMLPEERGMKLRVKLEYLRRRKRVLSEAFENASRNVAIKELAPFVPEVTGKLRRPGWQGAGFEPIFRGDDSDSEHAALSPRFN